MECRPAVVYFNARNETTTANRQWRREGLVYGREAELLGHTHTHTHIHSWSSLGSTLRPRDSLQRGHVVRIVAIKQVPQPCFPFFLAVLVASVRFPAAADAAATKLFLFKCISMRRKIV